MRADGVAIVLSWLLLRVVFFGILIYKVFFLYRPEFLALGGARVAHLTLSFVTGYALQLFWFYKMCLGLVAFVFAKKVE